MKHKNVDKLLETVNSFVRDLDEVANGKINL